MDSIDANHSFKIYKDLKLNSLVLVLETCKIGSEDLKTNSLWH